MQTYNPYIHIDVVKSICGFYIIYKIILIKLVISGFNTASKTFENVILSLYTFVKKDAFGI